MSESLKENWHIDKRISISHLLATASVVVGIMIWGGKIETRIALLEQGSQNTAETMQEIKLELKELNRKMDRFIESNRK